MSVIHHWEWTNKDARAGERKNLEKGEVEELQKRWRELADMSLNDASILENVKIKEDNINNAIESKFSKEELNDIETLEFKEFDSFKEKTGITEDNFYEAYENMYSSGFHLYNKETHKTLP